MAFYRVIRTDVTQPEEYDSAIVRASGRRQALELITKGWAGEPYPGFKSDGSNATVVKLEDGRNVANTVLMTDYVPEEC